VVIRSTAGTLDSPVGEVVAIASEHDEHAGIKRGPNTIFCFTLDGVRFCHLGDFGQTELRPEQRDAIGHVDVLFVPVGGGPTIGGAAAAELAGELGARVVVPMHYGHEGVDFLEPPDAFVETLGARVERLDASQVELDDLLASDDGPVVLLFAPPLS
jgi:L-ascorbate metabolism protein UlaG (beta-lactamase superfamily)